MRPQNTILTRGTHTLRAVCTVIRKSQEYLKLLSFVQDYPDEVELSDIEGNGSDVFVCTTNDHLAQDLRDLLWLVLQHEVQQKQERESGQGTYSHSVPILLNGQLYVWYTNEGLNTRYEYSNDQISLPVAYDRDGVRIDNFQALYRPL